MTEESQIEGEAADMINMITIGVTLAGNQVLGGETNGTTNCRFY